MQNLFLLLFVLIKIIFYDFLICQEVHPFVKMAISSPADDPAVKAALANYRATGCRLVNDKHKREC